MRGQRWAGDDDRRRRVRRRLLAVGGGLVLVIVVAGLVLAYDATQARNALTSAEDQARDLRRQVAAGDVDAARTSLAELKDSTGKAEVHTDGPLWYVAAKAPFVGPSFDAVQTISVALHGITKDGLEPLVDIADQLDADVFSPQDGRIDLEAIRDVSPGLQSADAVLARGGRDIQAIDPDDLVGLLRGSVVKLQTEVGDARSTVRAGSRAARLLPHMLGGSEKRSYLLAFQNNAEIRSSGGLPGAFAILTAKDGRIGFGRQGVGSKLPFFDDLPIRLSQDEKRLYSILLTSYWGDTTLTPDFPRTAEIMRAMVRKELDRKTDGVISVDPIALSYILEATGPIPLADGKRLTSDNAVQRLLNGVYLDLPGDAAQNAYFADAARRVFAAVVSGGADGQALVEALSKGVAENRILMESARDAEQRVLASTRIAGALPGDQEKAPHVGLYYNDATQTKLEYYLRKRTAVRATTCTDDGTQSFTASTTLRSTAPKNAGSLPGSILGRSIGKKRGTFRVVMTYYAPAGGLVTRLEIDGEEQPLNRAEHHGINVVILPVELAPGQETTVKASMFSGKAQRGDAVFATTPGIEATPNNVTIPSACD